MRYTVGIVFFFLQRIKKCCLSSHRLRTHTFKHMNKVMQRHSLMKDCLLIAPPTRLLRDCVLKKRAAS